MGVERRGALSFSVRPVGDRGAEGAHSARRICPPMQLQERATGARFDLSPLPIGIPDSSQKRPFRFRSGDCESNVRLVSHQEAPRRRRWREVSEAGCEISGGEKVFSRSFASFRGHVLAVYSLRRLPREWPKVSIIKVRHPTNVDQATMGI